ncbi:MAG: 30S ribosomal protein S17 [Endomicrobiales bacterium]|nr:30S ribosomal protein S17 [Endomicrobiales bacterium]
MERVGRKIKTGIVISDKSDKTRIVEVKRDFRVPMYEKVMKRRKKYYAHDEKNVSHAGDKIRIMETRPLSKLKRWIVVDVIKKA